MCLLCDQARVRQFQINGRSDGLVPFGLSIAPAYLIEEDFVMATRLATATDDILDYYLHASVGAVTVTVSGGGFGEQTIQSVSISSSDQAYFDAMVQSLDRIIDLDFRRSRNARWECRPYFLQK